MNNPRAAEFACHLVNIAANLRHNAEKYQLTNGKSGASLLNCLLDNKWDDLRSKEGAALALLREYNAAHSTPRIDISPPWPVMPEAPKDPNKREEAA